MLQRHRCNALQAGNCFNTFSILSILFPPPHALQRSSIYINVLGFSFFFSNVHVASDHKSLSCMRYAARLSNMITIVSALLTPHGSTQSSTCCPIFSGFELAFCASKSTWYACKAPVNLQLYHSIAQKHTFKTCCHDCQNMMTRAKGMRVRGHAVYVHPLDVPAVKWL